MSTDVTTTKKRQNRKRKHIPDSFYAAISPASYKISQIVNINAGNINGCDSQTHSGGFVFKYIDKEDNKRPIEQGKSIFLKHYGYNFGDIPSNGDLSFMISPPAITIEEIDSTSLTSEHLIRIREMSIMFTELTFSQIFALDKFIRENINHKRFISMHLTVGLQ